VEFARELDRKPSDEWWFDGRLADGKPIAAFIVCGAFDSTSMKQVSAVRSQVSGFRKKFPGLRP
jgi:hypothetical protein